MTEPKTPTWSIIQGDALKILPTFAPNTFDAVITDPPYASGGRTQSEKRPVSPFPDPGDTFPQGAGVSPEIPAAWSPETDRYFSSKGSSCRATASRKVMPFHGRRALSVPIRRLLPPRSRTAQQSAYNSFIKKILSCPGISCSDFPLLKPQRPPAMLQDQVRDRIQLPKGQGPLPDFILRKVGHDQKPARRIGHGDP